MKKIILHITAFVLLVTGSFLLSDGCWMRAKAVLAQTLLQHAWEETMATGKNTKPWPWADTWPVARLTMDRLGIDLIVLEGESGEVLAFGPGHLLASSISGMDGNFVVAGHRDTSFRFMRYLNTEDVLSVQIADGSIHDYRVNEMFTAKAEKLYLQETGRPSLTLITCYPFDALLPGTDLRYVVFADRMSGGV